MLNKTNDLLHRKLILDNNAASTQNSDNNKSH